MLVDVLLVVGDEGLGDGLADGVDLGGVATTGDADADVDVGELVKANNEEGLVDLKTRKSQHMGLLLETLWCRGMAPNVPVACHETTRAQMQGGGRAVQLSVSGSLRTSRLPLPRTLQAVCACVS